MAQAESKGGGPEARPLSPHLQVYTLLINMVMSIVHRLTGAALYFGTLILVAWLFSASLGRGSFETVTGLLGSPLGLLIMIGYTWALLHHALGGLRHLIWDTGRGFELGTVNTLSWLTIILSVAFTACIWIGILITRGV